MRVQQAVAELGVAGTRPEKAKKILAKIAPFSEAYAETVYRTNLATAYTAGRFRQAQDPDVEAITPAFEYTPVGDSSTRHNHLAARGLLASIKDGIWDRFSPPMGFNCRCDLRLVDRFELESRRLLLRNGQVKRYVPSGFGEAHPDKGFRVSRTDRRVNFADLDEAAELLPDVQPSPSMLYAELGIQN